MNPTWKERLGRRTEQARALERQVQASRAEHFTIDLGLNVFERDATVAGAMLAGALAYRLFVFLLPASLFLVSGLGLYADASGKTASEAVHEGGLHGLIAQEVAQAASGRGRLIVFLVSLPALLWATTTLYRAIAKVHAIVWHSSGRGVKITPRGLGIFGAALLTQLVFLTFVGWCRRHDQFAGIAALGVYLVVVAGSWLVVSKDLPHRRVHWTALIPGSVLFGVGMLFVNLFNVYITTRLVEGRADTYGALGIATALLFSLVIVGRIMVASAVLNSAIDEIRARGQVA